MRSVKMILPRSSGSSKYPVHAGCLCWAKPVPTRLTKARSKYFGTKTDNHAALAPVPTVEGCKTTVLPAANAGKTQVGKGNGCEGERKSDVCETPHQQQKHQRTRQHASNATAPPLPPASGESMDKKGNIQDPNINTTPNGSGRTHCVLGQVNQRDRLALTWLLVHSSM